MQRSSRDHTLRGSKAPRWRERAWLRPRAAAIVASLLIVLGVSGGQVLTVVTSGAAGTVPGKPTAVTAIPYNLSATVSWTAASANGTPIKSYTVTSTPVGAICTPSPATTTNCTATGLTNGVLVTFRVKATNGKGTGLTSTSSAGVTPLPVPNAPTTVVGAGRNLSATLRWTIPASNGTPITGYTVTSTPTSKTCTAAPMTTPTCTVANLKNGTNYHFRVVAKNAKGTGPPSTPSAIIVPGTKPGAPTNVVATPGNSKAKVTWTAPSANGTPIKKYVVTSTPTQKSCSTTGTTSCTVLALTNGTPNNFTVVATNTHGTGPASAPSSFVTPASPPTVGPTITHATAFNASARVTWSPLTAKFDGGDPITGYFVTAEIGTTPKATTVVTATSTTATITGLVNGTTYRLTVAAINGAGKGTPTTSVNVTPAATPTAPFGVTATPGDGEVEVTWTQPPANGSPITSYKVTSTTLTKTCVTPKGTDCLVTGLTNGTPYSFTVKAINKNGPSPTSAPTLAVTPSTSLPNPPTGVTVLPTKTSITVGWNEPTGNGASIIGYTAKTTPTSKTCTVSQTLTPSFTPAANLKCTISGLHYGVTYTVRVRASNGSGQSPPSAPSASFYLSNTPTSPLTVTAKAANASAKVTWKAPASTNGYPVTGYKVTSNTTTKSCTTAGTLSCTVAGLKNGTNYNFVVRATNKDGTSAPSAPSITVTPGTVPSAAPTLTAIKGTQTIINATWTPLPTTKDGGLPITSYQIKVKGTATTVKTTITAPASTGTVTKLSFGISYTVSVAAKNAAGVGPFSKTKNITLTGVPGPPLAPQIYSENQGAFVEWGRAVPNGTAVLTYIATSTTGHFSCTQTATKVDDCVVHGLTNGLSYTFVVTATNKQGTGPPSSPALPVTPKPVPSQVVNVTSTAGTASATVMFTVPTTGGSPITSYTVKGCIKFPKTGYTWTCTVSHTFTAPPTKVATWHETLAGLTNGVLYEFTVSASNANGQGPPSLLNTAGAIPSGLPVASSKISATVGKATGQATVKWTKPTTNGAPILGATVTSATGNFHCTAVLAVTTCVVTGLTDGTSYSFHVSPENKRGSSLIPSPTSAGVVPYFVPLSAPSITGTTPGNASIKVTWKLLPTATDNGSPITGYEVIVAQSCGCVAGTALVSATTHTATITTLVNGTTYTVKVLAKNLAGFGPAGIVLHVVAAAPPAQPTNATAYAGDTSAEIIWTAPVDNGTPIVSYTATATTGKFCTAPASQLTCTVTGLTNGTAYAFSVSATNLKGTGFPSTPTKTVTPATVPSPPPAPKAVGHAGFAAVTWTPSVSTNGSPITSYLVTSSPSKKTCTVAAGTPPMHCTVLSLANGTPYTFRVQAKSAIGYSAPSLASAPATPAKTPVAPAKPNVTVSLTKATVTWTAPTSNGTPITGYNVVSTPVGKTCSPTGHTLTCPISGLVYGTPYKFQVRAVNGAGHGPFSTFSTPVVASTMPQAAPVINASSAGATTVRITWTDVPLTKDGGSNITSYTVTVLHQATKVKTITLIPPTSTAETIKSLTPGLSYTVQIAAVNAKGTGPVATSPILTPATVPGIPSGVTGTPGDAMATVKWTAAPANGTAITLYTVTSTPPSKVCTTTTLTCLVKTLVDGTPYTFTVKATNKKGTGPASTPSAPVTPTSLPTAPVIQSVVPATTTATITWSASTTADGTSILSYAVKSTPVGKSCTSTTTSCQISGLTYGTSYKFRVKAHSAAGTGPTSNPSASVTPKAVPTAPTAVKATLIGTSATVTWTAPTPRGTALTGYVVTSFTGPSTTKTTTCTPVPATKTSCTFAGLTTGTAYTFKVKASNGKGFSTQSAASTPVTPLGPPLVAPVITGSSAGATTLQVTWTDVPATKNGGSAITKYQVTVYQGTSLVLTNTSPPTSVKITVNSVTEGDPYTVKVGAVNAKGAGPLATSPTLTPSAIPGAPTNAIATPFNVSALVRWTAPSANGTAITGYTVTSTPSGKTCHTTATLSCTVRTLTNGVAYTFKVKATNGRGPGPTSVKSNSVTPKTAPTAPTNVVATVTATTATVTWNAASTSNSTPITQYTVTSTPAGGFCHSAALTCTASGLTYGTHYKFRVHASNGTATGPTSLPSATVVPAAAPGKPTGVTPTAGNKSALVKWTAPSANGTAITGYTVTATPSAKTCHATTTAGCTVLTLPNRIASSFKVKATNGKGTGVTSTPSIAVTPDSTPTAPTGVTATTLTTTATVSWTAAATAGSTPITSYTVVTTPAGGTCSTAALKCTVSGLTYGTHYKFKVHASNGLVTGPTSALSATVVPAAAPGKPTGVTPTAGNRSALVKWTAPSANGTAITGYTVTATPSAKTCHATTTLGCTVLTLPNRIASTFKVKATNGKGTGVTSTPSSAVTPDSTPTAPTNVTVTTVATTATVSWTAATTAGGTSISLYTVATTPVGGTCSTAGLKCTVSGLTLGNHYKFKVHASNGFMTGPTSALSATVVPAAAPGKPTGVTATAGNRSALVKWTAPSANGTAITGYTVTATPSAKTCHATTTAGCTVLTLSNRIASSFKVKATNGKGTGVTSTLSSQVTPDSTPTAPTNVTVMTLATTATVSWTAAATAGSTPITSYTVVTTPVGGTCSTAALKCAVSSLTLGNHYRFKVHASNGIMTGPTSAPSATVIPATAPSAPTKPSVLGSGNTATVTWTAPAANGTAITSYTVVSTTGSKTCTPTPHPSRSCAVSGLTPNQTYQFKVDATNLKGTGPFSVLSTAVVAVTKPGPPVSVTATAGIASATVSWQPGPSNGTPITGYNVKSTQTSNGCTTTSALSCTVSGLTNGSHYEFTVKAVNKQGAGIASAPSATVTPGFAPTPTTITNVTTNATTATIFWAPAQTKANSGITKYTVTSTPTGKTCTSVPSASPSCTVTGLTFGTSYSFKVVATNAVGTGQPSAFSTAVTPKSAPGAVVHAKVFFTGPALVVSWKVPATNGTPIVSYTVQGTPGGLVCGPVPATKLSCAFNTLKPSTTYHFVVKATNGKGSGPFSPPSVAVLIAPTTAGASTSLGYWEVASDGGLFSFGGAKFHGSMGGKPLAKPIVGMTPTPDGQGYWEVASDGGLFSFGNAIFYGSMGGRPLSQPIIGMAATPDGKGYWEVASDGGLFSFGDARFHGSMGGRPLAKPIVAMTSTPDGQGYWEVASDGGLFSFGDAIFYGSMGGKHLSQPIIGMAATPDGKGYWEVASDGGLFSFGDAKFHGSMGGRPLDKPIIGFSPTADGLGYWEVASDGGVFSFGDATFLGSEGGKPIVKPIVGVATLH